MSLEDIFKLVVISQRTEDMYLPNLQFCKQYLLFLCEISYIE